MTTPSSSGSRLPANPGAMLEPTFADQMADDLETFGEFIRDNPDLAPRVFPQKLMVFLHGDDVLGQMIDFLTRATKADARITMNETPDHIKVQAFFGKLELEVFGRNAEICTKVITGYRHLILSGETAEEYRWKIPAALLAFFDIKVTEI